jgi:hypothetical protein
MPIVILFSSLFILTVSVMKIQKTQEVDVFAGTLERPKIYPDRRGGGGCKVCYFLKTPKL